MWRWILGWFMYPLVVILDPGNGPYHEARLAIRDWLHSFPPSKEKRLRAHHKTAGKHF